MYIDRDRERGRVRAEICVFLFFPIRSSFLQYKKVINDQILKASLDFGICMQKLYCYKYTSFPLLLLSGWCNPLHFWGDYVYIDFWRLPGQVCNFLDKISEVV